MSLVKLSFINFKASLKNYISLIASLAFTVLIIFNFFNLMASPIMESLGQMNSRNLKIVIQCVLIVLSCFMFFFVWYATNVFLTKRKKEIGIYIFMGLTNQRIGKLYMLETLMIGLVSLMMGIGFGILVSQLFTMILITISDIEVQLTFQVSLSAVLWSCILYLIVYFIFVFKGYVNLIRSSVLDMVSANRQNEYIKQNKIILFLKALLGIIILVLGYYFAIKKGGMETMSNSLLAVVLVIIGVYLLFGGFLPLTYQSLASHKNFLYRYQRTLWLNQMIYRMKKNYRTYAIVTVLMICSVTALATGVAMYDRYQIIHDFENFKKNPGKISEISQKNVLEPERKNPYLTMPIDIVRRHAETGVQLAKDVLQKRTEEKQNEAGLEQPKDKKEEKPNVPISGEETASTKTSEPADVKNEIEHQVSGKEKAEEAEKKLTRNSEQRERQCREKLLLKRFASNHKISRKEAEEQMEFLVVKKSPKDRSRLFHQRLEYFKEVFEFEFGRKNGFSRSPPSPWSPVRKPIFSSLPGCCLILL